MAVKIEVAETGIPHGVRAIAEQLPRTESLSAGAEVTIVFTGREFVFLTGLTLLASWRKSLPAGVLVRVDDRACLEPTRSFLSNTGFREIIETGRERPKARPRVGKIPLQPITNRLSVEATVGEITSIFDDFAGQVSDTNPFRTLISELAENVLAHSEASSPGYACARVLPNDLRAEVCLADSGIGIRESFLRGTNQDAIERIKKGANPLEMALEGLTSSKPTARRGSWKSYFGFGLFVTRRLVQENRGQMAIISDDQELIVTRHAMNTRTLARPFQGTFVGIVLDLANPLPLDEIYAAAADKIVPARTVTANSLHFEQKSEETGTPQAAPGRTETSNDSANATLIELRHYGTELLTREVGTAIRADIATRLAREEIVVVNVEGISDVTPSVADEAFGKLAEVIGFEEFTRRVVIQGGSPLFGRLLEFVLKARGVLK